MLHAVAEALHLTGVSDSTIEGEGAAGTNTPHWSELTERDAQRLVAVGLQLNPNPEVAVAAVSAVSAQAAQRVRGQFCFQYIHPWECEPPVQVLRLREEIQRQSRPRSHSLDSPAIGTSASATAVVHPRTGDSKRRRSFLSALQSPLRARSTNAVSEREDGPSSRQIATVSEQSTLSTAASPRCKVEVLTPSIFALAEQTAVQRVPALQQQQSQPPQQQQILRTPEPIMTGKRKRVSVTISPPALPQAPRVSQAAAMPSVRSSSRWVSPKPERLLRQQQQTPREQHQQQLQAEEPQQPPLKTRRLTESGVRTPSMASRFASTLREFFKEMCGNGSEDTDPSDEVGGHESGGESGPGDDASDRESDAESDASETSSTSSTWSSSCDSSNNVVGDREFGDCDQYGGNATLLADIQDVLEPVWSLLETTSSRFQRFVVWGEGARDLSSSSARSPPLAQKSKFGSCQSIGATAGIVTTTELVFDGAEFEDENSEIEWTNAIEKPDKLAVRTRRQCREMRQLSTAWRLCSIHLPSREKEQASDDGMALNTEPPVVVMNDVTAEEEAALLTEFRSKPPTEVKISLNGCESPYYLSECNCVLSFKKGRYAESKCEAHKLTLRNSRPHPEPLGSPIQDPSNDTTTPTHCFLASPSRTALIALSTSHLAGSHQGGSTVPLSSPSKIKAMMKESKSTSALPQRSREFIELEKEGCRVPSSIGLLPSLSTPMLLHLSPANSPASLAAGNHWSPSAKLSSSSHTDKTLCVGMVLGVLTEFHYDECGAVEPSAKGSDGNA